MYYLWRRNDGYVAATTHKPANYTGANGEQVTFEILLVSESFDEIRARVDDMYSVREAN